MFRLSFLILPFWQKSDFLRGFRRTNIPVNAKSLKRCPLVRRLTECFWFTGNLEWNCLWEWETWKSRDRIHVCTGVGYTPKPKGCARICGAFKRRKCDKCQRILSSSICSSVNGTLNGRFNTHSLLAELIGSSTTCIFCDRAKLWIDKVTTFSCGRSSVPRFQDQEGLGLEFVLSVACLQLNAAAKTIINIYFQINKRSVIKWICSGVISGPPRTFPNGLMKDDFTVGVSATRGQQFCKSYLNQAE